MASRDEISLDARKVDLPPLGRDDVLRIRPGMPFTEAKALLSQRYREVKPGEPSKLVSDNFGPESKNFETSVVFVDKGQKAGIMAGSPVTGSRVWASGRKST